jgi:parallel beta-helix repeat protein
MKKATLLVVLVMLFSVSYLALTDLPVNVRATTLFVGGSGSGNYTSIGLAVFDASPGDTIYVYKGTYYEHLWIYKTLSLVGEDGAAVVNAGGWGNVTRVLANWVNITGFVVEGGSNDYRDPGAGIYLDNVQNCNISNNHARNNYIGFRLGSSDSNVITNNTVVSNGFGVFLDSSETNTITNNTFSSSWYGVYLRFSYNNNITRNNMSENYAGVLLSSSSHNIVVSNNASSRREGIRIERSHYNVILNNTASYGYAEGIYIESSIGNILDRNVMVENGVYLMGSSLEHWNSHTIGTSNTVNGKPVYYWKNITGGRIPPGVGQVILVNCTGVVVENQDVSEGSVGMELAYSPSSVIANNSVINNKHDGLYLYKSGDAVVINNTVRYNDENGISLLHSGNSHIANNTVDGSGENDIYLQYSSYSVVTHNRRTSWYGGGVELYRSSNNVISNNSAYHMDIWDSSHNRIADNIRSRIGIRSSDYNVVTNNTLYGSSTSSGLRLMNSQNNTIYLNSVFNSRTSGIYLTYSRDNAIVNNTIANNDDGIYFVRSDNNSIYHNKFIDNVRHAYDKTQTNIWDNGYPSGGNYWDDYTGADKFSGPNQDQPGSDCIGDTPYSMYLDNEDAYPMTSPYGFYLPRPPMAVGASLSGKDFENVTLIWSPSPDDGMGFGIVTGYRIYRHIFYDSSLLNYKLIASLPNGTFSFVDSLAGEGNPKTYFYQVCALDLNGNLTCSKNQAAKYTRTLWKGLNLVSVPLAQSDESIETVFQTVAYDKIWRYDSRSQEWTSIIKSKPYPGDLENVNHSVGVWIDVTEESNFTVAGVVPLTTTIHLHTGWNLVGFPSFQILYFARYLRAETNATRVEGVHPFLPPYFLRIVLDDDALMTGYGYWVEVENETTWTVADS